LEKAQVERSEQGESMSHIVGGAPWSESVQKPKPFLRKREHERIPGCPLLNILIGTDTQALLLEHLVEEGPPAWGNQGCRLMLRK
jgi:hypothetical protein